MTITRVHGPALGPASCPGWLREPKSKPVLVLDSRDDPLAEHHTLGGRRASALDPNLKGLPVLPFAAMAEMTAQVAALVVTPGLFLTRTRAGAGSQVGALRRGAGLPASARQARVFAPATSGSGSASSIGDRAARTRRRDPSSRRSRSSASLSRLRPQASPWGLDHPRPSRFTAESVYGEGWLFHGPPLQALVHIGHFSEQGMDGTIRVLPWEPLLKNGSDHRDCTSTRSFSTSSLTCLVAGGSIISTKATSCSRFEWKSWRSTANGLRSAPTWPAASRVREIQRHRIRVRSRDRPTGWDGLDADSRLGRLAIPLAEPLS